MKLPSTPDQLLRQAFQTLESEDRRNMKAGQSQPFLLLTAPNGTVYKITVNNAGQLVAQVMN